MNKEAKARLVKLAREAEADDAWWEFAEALLEEVPLEDAADSASSHRNDGSYAELEEIAEEIEQETGYHFKVNRLRNLRATARAWPANERDPEVEFAVHERLRSPETKRKLAGYKRRAIADHRRSPGSQSPRLTVHRLRIYRAEERPRVSWAEQQAKRGRAWVNKALSIAELDGIWDAFVEQYNERRKELGG